MSAIRREVHPQFFLPYEVVRPILSEPTALDIAYPPYPWTRLYGFIQDGEHFDVWVHWDGRARIEWKGASSGCVVLRMPAPAGELLKAMDARRKAAGD